VDKQIENKCPRAHTVLGGLFFGFLKTDDDLTALGTDRIRKNVRCVVLATELFIEGARFSWTNEHKRYIPEREYVRRDRNKCGTRRTRAPREVLYGDTGHSCLALAAFATRVLTRRRVNLTELHELIVFFATHF
jgi:hypothetical protein